MTLFLECMNAIVPTLTDVVNHFYLTGEFPFIFNRKAIIEKDIIGPREFEGL